MEIRPNNICVSAIITTTHHHELTTRLPINSLSTQLVTSINKCNDNTNNYETTSAFSLIALRSICNRTHLKIKPCH